MELAKTIGTGRPVPEYVDDDGEFDPEPSSAPKEKKKGPFLKLEKPLRKKRPVPEDAMSALLGNGTKTKTKTNGKKTKKETEDPLPEVEPIDCDMRTGEVDLDQTVYIGDEEVTVGEIVNGKQKNRSKKKVSGELVTETVESLAAKLAWKTKDEDVRAWEVVCICGYLSGILGALGIFFGFASARYFTGGVILAVVFGAVGHLAGLLLLQFCVWCDEAVRDRATRYVAGCLRRLAFIKASFMWVLRK